MTLEGNQCFNVWRFNFFREVLVYEKKASGNSSGVPSSFGSLFTADGEQADHCPQISG